VLSRAAARVLVTAERLVPRERIRAQPELTLVPGFLVEAAAIVPRGAWPGSAHPDYGIDDGAIERYLVNGDGSLELHLEEAPEPRSAARA
jgi:glutaconate CoA-transferase subunit A